MVQGANTEEAKSRGNSVTVVEKSGEMRSVKGVTPTTITPTTITPTVVHPPITVTHHHSYSGLILFINTILLIWLIIKLKCCKEGK